MTTLLLDRLQVASHVNLIDSQTFRSLRGQLKNNPEAVENFLTHLFEHNPDWPELEKYLSIING